MYSGSRQVKRLKPAAAADTWYTSRRLYASVQSRSNMVYCQVYALSFDRIVNSVLLNGQVRIEYSSSISNQSFGGSPIQTLIPFPSSCRGLLTIAIDIDFSFCLKSSYPVRCSLLLSEP